MKTKEIKNISIIAFNSINPQLYIQHFNESKREYIIIGKY